MSAWICATCGVQYADTPEPPPECIICSDERQYVPESGQRWTTLAELAAAGHRTRFDEIAPGLYGHRVEPSVGIGQQSLLVRTDAGNLLWDPNGFLDETGIEWVRAHGGLAAVSASHPHMYGVMIEWSEAFGGVPVWIPEADKEWITRPDPAVQLWSGRAEILPEVTLVQCGGHFPGSAAVYWPGADGNGTVLAGDTIMAARDRRWVSFMRSYPNMLPLSGGAVRKVAAALEDLAFERLYDNFGGLIPAGADAAVQRSADRYARWVGGEFDHVT